MEDLPRARSHPRANGPRPLARHRPAHRPWPAPSNTHSDGHGRGQQRQTRRGQVAQPIRKRQYPRVDRVHHLRRPLLYFRHYSP
jgi:hypothetical protein